MPAYEHPDLVALDELEDVLEAYAEARLSPSGPVLARMRRAVLSEAAAVNANRAVAARIARRGGAGRPRFPWLPRVRVPALGVASVTAAAMGLVLGTAVLTAPAGSPFYGARVALEQAFLPTQIDARLASHEEHLMARLAEAQAAASRGDAAALADALGAYQAEVDAAVEELGTNGGLLTKLEDVLNKHVAVLEALEAKVPEHASINKALASSQKAIEKIKEKASHARPSNAPGGPPDDPPGKP